MKMCIKCTLRVKGYVELRVIGIMIKSTFLSKINCLLGADVAKRHANMARRPTSRLYQCWKTRNFSWGRGRARGPNLKFSAGAGGRGGQISKNLRARAGAGANFQNSCGRGRARGAKKIQRAGAGGAPARKAPRGHPRAPARANTEFYYLKKNS